MPDTTLQKAVIASADGEIRGLTRPAATQASTVDVTSFSIDPCDET